MCSLAAGLAVHVFAGGWAGITCVRWQLGWQCMCSLADGLAVHVFAGGWVGSACVHWRLGWQCMCLLAAGLAVHVFAGGLVGTWQRARIPGVAAHSGKSQPLKAQHSATETCYGFISGRKINGATVTSLFKQLIISCSFSANTNCDLLGKQLCQIEFRN